MEKQTIGLVFATKLLGEALANFLNLNPEGKYECFSFGFEDALAGNSQPLDYILIEVKQPKQWPKIKILIAKLLKETQAKIILIGDLQVTGAMMEFVKMGAWILFSTENGTADLLKLLDEAQKGLCRRDAFTFINKSLKDKMGVLTPRERQILLLIRDEDLGNKQIARRLHLSLYTVKNHVHNIIKKLGAADRREAARTMFAWQVDNDIISP